MSDYEELKPNGTKENYKMKKSRIRNQEINEKYLNFFNREVDEFLTGIPHEPSRLKDSVVSLNHVKPPSGKLKVNCESQQPFNKNNETVGTVWTSTEKEIFFTFLGRYGISNIERIQAKLRTKSVIEIQNYYDILNKSTNIFKFRKRKFKKLVKYSELPIAYEMDANFVSMEEDFANLINFKEKLFVRNKFSLSDALEEDSENELLNVDQLVKLIPFFAQPHLRDQYGIGNKHRASINYESVQYLRRCLKAFATSLVTDLVLSELDSGRRELETFNAQGELIINVNDLKLKRTLTNVSSQYRRDFLLPRYFMHILERLNLKLVADEEDSLVDSASVNKKSAFFHMLLGHKSNYKFYRKNEIKFDTFDATPQPLSRHLGRGRFIADDLDDNSLLLNDLAFSIFIRETVLLIEDDLERSFSYQLRLLQELGLVEEYLSATPDPDISSFNYDDYEELYFYSVKSKRLPYSFIRMTVIDDLPVHFANIDDFATGEIPRYEGRSYEFINLTKDDFTHDKYALDELGRAQMEPFEWYGYDSCGESDAGQDEEDVSSEQETGDDEVVFPDFNIARIQDKLFTKDHSTQAEYYEDYEVDEVQLESEARNPAPPDTTKTDNQTNDNHYNDSNDNDSNDNTHTHKYYTDNDITQDMLDIFSYTFPQYK